MVVDKDREKVHDSSIGENNIEVYILKDNLTEKKELYY